MGQMGAKRPRSERPGWSRHQQPFPHPVAALGSKMGTKTPAHPSPRALRKLPQALTPGRDLKGKALPGGLALTLMAEVPKDFTEGRSRFRDGVSLTSGAAPLRER